MNKVLVIGDSCNDEFQYGICDRINPEAPVPIFLPKKTIRNGGMVLNVFENLTALGVETYMITNKNKPTKIRYVDDTSNQILLRIDKNDKTEHIKESILQRIDYNQYDAIIISDYNKGFLTKEDIFFISQKHPIVFMDTKKKIKRWADDIGFIKINEKEFQFNEKYLLNKYSGELIITKGKDGAVLNSSVILDNERHFPIENKREIRDLSGAGDTFLAGLVASYIKNNDICKAIKFANKCASWVITQRGVTIIDIDKI